MLATTLGGKRTKALLLTLGEYRWLAASPLADRTSAWTNSTRRGGRPSKEQEKKEGCARVAPAALGLSPLEAHPSQWR